jgi:hypothetical protein
MQHSLYSPNTIKMLYTAYIKEKKLASICTIARQISFDSNGDNLLPYTGDRWKIAKKGSKSFFNVALGVGGVLYSPKFFNESIFSENILELAPKASDFWFYFHLVTNGIPIKTIGSNYPQDRKGKHPLYTTTLGKKQKYIMNIIQFSGLNEKSFYDYLNKKESLLKQ